MLDIAICDDDTAICQMLKRLIQQIDLEQPMAVSYTHLDVYKRQLKKCACLALTVDAAIF